MNDKINGFVLSIKDYHDNDVMMQVLTREYGILSLVGKAAKKLTSKNHFFTMCLYEFIIDYKDNKTIYTVHGNKILESFVDDKDLIMMSYKNIFLEAALKNKEEMPISLYDSLLFVFRNINDKDKYVLGCMFFSYLIKEHGITPIVDSCSLCSEKKVIALSNREGGFLCHRHLGQEEILSVERLKKFRLIIKGTFENFNIIREFDYDRIDLKFVVSFYLENMGISLRSFDFFLSL